MLGCCVFAAVLFIIFSSRTVRSTEQNGFPCIIYDLGKLVKTLQDEIFTALNQESDQAEKTIETNLDKITRTCQPKNIPLAIEKMVSAIADSNISSEEKIRLYQDIIRKIIWFDKMAKNSLGRDFKSLTEEEKKQYQKDFLIYFCTRGPFMKVLSKIPGKEIKRPRQIRVNANEVRIDFDIIGGKTPDYNDVTYPVSIWLHYQNRWLIADYSFMGERYVFSNLEFAGTPQEKIRQILHEN